MQRTAIAPSADLCVGSTSRALVLRVPVGAPAGRSSDRDTTHGSVSSRPSTLSTRACAGNAPWRAGVTCSVPAPGPKFWHACPNFGRPPRGMRAGQYNAYGWSLRAYVTAPPSDERLACRTRRVAAQAQWHGRALTQCHRLDALGGRQADKHWLSVKAIAVKLTAPLCQFDARQGGICVKPTCVDLTRVKKHLDARQRDALTRVKSAHKPVNLTCCQPDARRPEA